MSKTFDEIIDLANSLSNQDLCDLFMFTSDRFNVAVFDKNKDSSTIGFDFKDSDEYIPCCVNGTAIQINIEIDADEIVESRAIRTQEVSTND